VIETMPVTGVEVAPFVVSYKMPDTSPLQNLIEHSEAVNSWGDSTVGANLIKPELRKSTQINLPQLGFNQQQINDLAPLNFAGACLFDYLLNYPEASMGFPSFEVREPPQIIKYEQGDAYHQAHADIHPHFFPNRHLTFCLYLNTVEKGGELCFVRQGVEVKPNEGTAVIFPAGWTHAHHTKPTNSTRYVFQLWWSFADA
tara:strand:- start:5565 stop:6164 length:600 start_codon:yes stop_codon:yes gene_type:complete